MGHSRASIIAASLAATFLTQPAIAQSAQDGGELGDIVVTARKSNESLQEVPLAITALGSATLENANTREMRDVATLTPGLNIGGDAQERGQQPSIRGLSFTGDAGAEGNVAVMLDGIYMANSSAMSMGLMDFERIEVVKGPQSALYGANAFAGAINYVSKAPPEKFEGKAKFRVGNYGSGSALLSIGAPIVDGLISFRAAGTYDHAGGTYTDPVNKKEIGGYTKKDASLQFRITPSAMTTIDLGFYYGDDKFGRPLQVTFANNCAQDPAGAFTDYCGKLPSTESLTLVASTIEPDASVGNDRKVKHARMKVTQDVGFGTITANLGYFDVKQRYFNDLFGVRDGLTFRLNGTDGATVNLPGFFGGAFNNKDYSAELRIASNADQPLRWALGGYFYKTDQEGVVDVGFNSDPIPAGRTIVCPGGFACQWLTPGGVRFDDPGRTLSHNRQASVFASLTYDITDRLTVAAEGRYTDELKKSNVLSVITAAGADPDGPNGQRAKFHYFNPRFTANYQATPDNMLYATVAKGTKSGGFNQRATDPSELAYDPESNWTYEIGSKNMLFGGKVRFNIAAFYVDWTDLQVLVPSASSTTIGSITQNYGSVKAYGGEVELAAKLAPGLSVNTGLAYTNPKFGSDSYDYSNVTLCRRIASCSDRIVTDAPSPRGPVSAVSLDGLTRNQVSKWQITAAVDVDQPLWQDWSWFANASYKFESKQYTQIDNIRYTPARNTLGLQAGVKEQNIRLAVYVQNALNDLTPYAAAGGQGITRYNDLMRYPKMNVPERRRIGVSLDYTF